MLKAEDSNLSIEPVKAQPVQPKYKPIAERKVVLFAFLVGLILALAAPGLDQWYLSWFVFSAVLVLTVTAKEPWQAALRGLAVGFTYHLVYLSWFLTFRPVYCQGTFSVCPEAITALFWVMTSYFEGLLLGVGTCLIRAVPMTGGWLPQRYQGRWRLPSFVVVPALWLLVDRMVHTTQLLGFPWASLQYGQYKQLIVLQVAPLIGGVGIGAWIVLVNLNIAAYLARLPLVERLLGMSLKETPENALGFISKKALIINTLATVVLSLALLAFGQNRLNSEEALLSSKPKVMAAAVQAGLSDVAHKVSSAIVFKRYFDQIARVPSGSVCIWPEWAVPIDFSHDRKLLEASSRYAAACKQNWVLGCFDNDIAGRKFNSVCAVDDKGTILPNVYHKRYLVPVGEYTPDFIRLSPIGVLLYGPGKKYNDSSSGDAATVFDLKAVKVSPVVCFECAYPRVCAQSVLAGGQLLSDSSDNSWFCRSILSDQMVAFCVMRAAENHRSFVFATALGPSAIIDSSGHILKIGPREEAAAISNLVPVERDITPFTRWCF
ncbi:apolipoprotein N-acyltransferase [soil metagenome]